MRSAKSKRIVLKKSQLESYLPLCCLVIRAKLGLRPSVRRHLSLLQFAR